MSRSLLTACVALSAGILLFPSLSLAQGTKPEGPKVVDPFKEKGPDEKRPAKREVEKQTEKLTGKVDLRPKFEKGQVIRFKMELDQKSKTLIPAMDEKPTESTSRQEIGLVFTVKNVTDESTVVELKFSSVKMTKKSDEGKEEFDSSQPASKDGKSTLAPSLRALSKTTFTVHLDKDGNVTNIDGGEALTALDAFGVSPSSTGGAPSGLPLPNPGGGGTGGSGFKDALGSIFNIKKGSGLVEVGEEWSNSDTLDTGLFGKFKLSDTHKLRSHTNGEAKISVIGSIESDSNADSQLTLVKISDSSFVGDYIWNTREGMLRRMNLHQHVVMETAAAGGVKLTTDMKSVVTRN